MRPKVAILQIDTLAAIGLRTMLQEVMPFMEVSAFNAFEQLAESEPDSFVHYFVAQTIAVEHRQFFLDRCRKTIVLSPSQDSSHHLQGFHSLCVSLPEEQLVRSLLALEQSAHAGGRNLPPMPQAGKASLLSGREIEVLSLIAQGKMNKEIADRLCISLSTVVSHRKNIIEKLGLRTVSSLTIYAVTHGYVDINSI